MNFADEEVDIITLMKAAILGVSPSSVVDYESLKVLLSLDVTVDELECLEVCEEMISALA